MATTGNTLFLIGGGTLATVEAAGNWKFDLTTKKWSVLAVSPVGVLADWRTG